MPELYSSIMIMIILRNDVVVIGIKCSAGALELIIHSNETVALY